MDEIISNFFNVVLLWFFLVVAPLVFAFIDCFFLHSFCVDWTAREFLSFYFLDILGLLFLIVWIPDSRYLLVHSFDCIKNFFDLYVQLRSGTS